MVASTVAACSIGAVGGFHIMKNTHSDQHDSLVTTAVGGSTAIIAGGQAQNFMDNKIEKLLKQLDNTMSIEEKQKLLKEVEKKINRISKFRLGVAAAESGAACYIIGSIIGYVSYGR